MALEISIENFENVCSSVERRGEALKQDIQTAVELALDYWDSNNRNPRYVTALYRSVHKSKGLSAGKLKRYVEDFTSLEVQTVKGEVKFVNTDGTEDDQGRLIALKYDRVGLLKENWATYKPEADDEEFDARKTCRSSAKKCAKQGLTREEALAAFAAEFDAAAARGNSAVFTAPAAASQQAIAETKADDEAAKKAKRSEAAKRAAETRKRNKLAAEKAAA